MFYMKSLDFDSILFYLALFSVLSECIQKRLSEFGRTLNRAPGRWHGVRVFWGVQRDQ